MTTANLDQRRQQRLEARKHRQLEVMDREARRRVQQAAAERKAILKAFARMPLKHLRAIHKAAQQALLKAR